MLPPKLEMEPHDAARGWTVSSWWTLLPPTLLPPTLLPPPLLPPPLLPPPLLPPFCEPSDAQLVERVMGLSASAAPALTAF